MLSDCIDFYIAFIFHIGLIIIILHYTFIINISIKSWNLVCNLIMCQETCLSTCLLVFLPICLSVCSCVSLGLRIRQYLCCYPYSAYYLFFYINSFFQSYLLYQYVSLSVFSLTFCPWLFICICVFSSISVCVLWLVFVIFVRLLGSLPPTERSTAADNVKTEEIGIGETGIGDKTLLLFNKSYPDLSSSPYLPPVSTPNTIHHSRLTVCLPDSLDLSRCLSILFWISAYE